MADGNNEQQFDNTDDIFDSALEQQFTSESDSMAGEGAGEELTPEELLAGGLEEEESEEAAEPAISDLLDDLKSEEDEDEDEEEEDDDEEDKADASGGSGRARKRIQKLSTERRAAEERAQQLEVQLQQQQSYLQQMQQQAYYQQQQFQQQMLEMQQRALKPEANPEPDFSHLPLAEQIEKRAEWRAEQKLNSRASVLEEQLEQLKQAQAQQLNYQRQLQENYARNQRLQGYQSAASQAVSPLFETFEESDKEQLAEPLEEMVMAFSAAAGEEPTAVGPRFQKYLDAYYEARLRGHVRSHKQRASRGRKLPNTPQSKAPGASQKKAKFEEGMDLDQLFAASFNG